MSASLMRLCWKWVSHGVFKQNHGLTYDEDFRQYQLELRQAISRSGGAPVISLDDARRLLVSPYSYNLPDSGYGAV